ncbi:MAG TPA: hypothetical protein VFO52_13475 [Longimicrobiales bacterium]|nr:hypothetical protein [Longimicrobiales bacterium]
MPDTHSHTADRRAWWLLLLVCAAILLWLLHAELLFTATVPAGYDLTGHIMPIAELRDRLLPQLRVHGWSAQWFAGFPLFYFYFPLPALLTALLSLVLPLGSALKIVTVSGLLALPFAFYALLRALDLSRAQAAVGASIAATFLLMQSFWFLGGNIASTLAGEFAMSISLTLSIFYLAVVLRAPNSLRGALLPGALLAAVALSHLVTTFAIVLVTATMLLAPARRRVVITSWVIGFLLAAFWALPFLLRHGEMAQVYNHADRSVREVLPLELWPVLIPALAGVLALRRERTALPLLLLTLSGLAGYLFADRLVYPGRFLPYWFIGIHLLAGYGIARIVIGGSRHVLPVLALAAPLLMLNAVRGVGYLRDWSQSTFAGIEARPSWPALQQLYTELQSGSGRIYWEQAPDKLAMLGSRNLAAATPYFAENQQVLNGLWSESSSVHDELVAIDSLVARVAADTTGAAAASMKGALARLHSLGVTRFIALNRTTAAALARAPGVQLVRASGPFALFNIPAAAMVDAQSANAQVEVLEWSDERIRFRSNAPGRPHIVRMAYFPNWRLSGGEVQRGPNALLLVTPATREVKLEFRRTWVELLGATISLLAALGLIAFAARMLPGKGHAREQG